MSKPLNNARRLKRMLTRKMSARAIEAACSLVNMMNEQTRITPNNTVVVAEVGGGSNGHQQAQNNDSVVPNVDKMTLTELDHVTTLLAKRFLSDYKCQKGDAVVIFMEKSPEFVVTYIAALKAGGAYLPLDVSYPKPLIQSILEEVQAAVICTKSAYKEQLPDACFKNTFVFGDDWKGELEKDAEKLNGFEMPDLCLDDLAYIVYSSGTTGKPKGIQCPQRGAVVSYLWRYNEFPYKDDDRVATNVFFVWELLRPILKGTTMCIVPDHVIYDPPELCAFLRRHRITSMLFTPSLIEAVLDTQETEDLRQCLETFRIMWLCGEVVTTVLLERIVAALPWVQVVNLYSVSECHDVAAADLTQWLVDIKTQLGQETGSGKPKLPKFAPVGRLLPDVRVAILDDNHEVQPIGVAGEIFVGGPTLAVGYINRPELNKQRFFDTPKDLIGKFGPRLYRTGDWGYLLSDGSLEICGRCDSMVKVRGYSVEIQAVESTLLQLPYIHTCSVLATGAEGDDKQLAAYVVLKETMSRKEIRAHLKRRLPFYMIPSYFIIMDSLPLLPASSKVDKKALPQVDPTRDVAEADALPQTATEKRLARIWTDTLNLQQIDIQESFFDLGGHSLLAARVLKRVTEEFSSGAIGVKDLFENPTVYAFARLIDGGVEVRGRRHTSPLNNLNLLEEVDSYEVKDAVLDLSLRAFWRSLRWENRFSTATVLLTGATGFLGSYLLRELLLNSRVHVVCLVRETPGTAADARLKASLKKFGLLGEHVEAEVDKRVSVVKGDVALVQLGISEADYHFFSYDIDFVIHAAAYVNLVYPYQALHGCNVLGTHNILLFCHTNKVKPLHYISTDAVFPWGSRGGAENAELKEEWRQLTDGYSQSKWVAEQLVQRSQKRGLPAIIYRLGNQGAAADEQVGYWNPQDFMYLLLYGCITTNMCPDIKKWKPEVTPVDFCAKFIITVATERFRTDSGKIFHLMNQAAIDWWQLITCINEAGYLVNEVPWPEFVRKIETFDVSGGNSNVRLLDRLIDTFIEDVSFFEQQSTYTRENTEAVCAAQGWTYPVVDAVIMRKWLRKLAKLGQLPRPMRIVETFDGLVKALEGRVCIVTGASSGIGEAIAHRLAVDGGARVVAVARRTDRLAALCDSISKEGGVAMFCQCDVVDRNQVELMVQKAEKAFDGRVDVLVNCAGVMYYTLMENVQEQQWQQQIDINCKGTMNCIGAVLKGMVERKCGHILNITSDAGKKAFAGLAVYSGTKHFIEGMSAALRQEVAVYGVKITNVQPGDVATKLADKSTDQSARKLYDGTIEGDDYALKASDVARAVLYALNQPPQVAVNELLIEPTSAPL